MFILDPRKERSDLMKTTHWGIRKTTHWGARLLKQSSLAALAALVVAATPGASPAEPVVSGGSLVWSVKGKLDPVKKTITPVVGKNYGKDIGVTVLCTVYDRTEGAKDDIWGTNIKNLEKMFVKGT